MAINLRLLSLLIEGLSGWLGARVAWDVPLRIALLEPLEAHYDARPWLAWAAWLLGVALLSVRRIALGSASGKPAAHSTSDNQSRRLARWLPFAVLTLLVLIGGVGRMVELWPQSYGLSRFPYDDEGVYAGTSQLFLQGILPYRDYFFAHPPMAAIAYAPAMAYHFTEWGSPTSFMMARYLSVFYSLVTLALLFGIGYRFTGLWGGTLAGGLWAVDGRVVEINRKIMLEGPLVLLSCAAVLLYLWVRPGLGEDEGPRANDEGRPKARWYSALRSPHLAFFLVGAIATLSALTKIAGLACLLAIVADMVWLRLENRRVGKGRTRGSAPTGDSPTLDTLQSKIQNPRSKIMRPFLSLVLGALAAFLVVVGPFLLLAPQQFLREVLFFQFLRPGDGVVDTPARVGDLTASLANALTPLMAALGFLVLSLWVWVRVRGSLGPWRVGILWAFFSLILFTYSRSFYQHYYIQLAAPLCLLGACVSLLPDLWRRSALARRITSAGRRRVVANLLPLGLLLLCALPLLVLQWAGMTTRQCPHCEDRIFELVGRYANDAVPPGAPVLSTDEQFNILAARPPSRSTSTGYLVDSYGHMIYLGLDLDTRDWGDLIGASVRGEHGNDPYAVMQSVRPQADFLARASLASLIVVHERGLARLSDATVQALESTYKVAERQSRYTIYRGNVSGGTEPNSQHSSSLGTSQNP
ncbi:MAG: hypothetical protein WCD37_16905 [Chloroflexia bacterium]